MNTNTKNKVVEIKYAGLDFTVDFSKKGIPSIWHNGKLLKAILNKRLNRYHFSVCVPRELVGVVPQTHFTSNGYSGVWHEYRYRLVAAAK